MRQPFRRFCLRILVAGVFTPWYTVVNALGRGGLYGVRAT